MIYPTWSRADTETDSKYRESAAGFVMLAAMLIFLDNQTS